MRYYIDRVGAPYGGPPVDERKSEKCICNICNEE